MSEVERLHRRVDVVTRRVNESKRSLALWRWVFYSTGISAVIAATLAGASSLAEFWGVTTAGILALVAAVLTAVEKFLAAGDKVGKLAQCYTKLRQLQDLAWGAVADADAGVFADGSVTPGIAEICAQIDKGLQDVDAGFGAV